MSKLSVIIPCFNERTTIQEIVRKVVDVDLKPSKPKLSSSTTVTVLLLSYSWQSSAPRAETELMRSQVLRRLGHASVADQIERSVLEAEMSGGG